MNKKQDISASLREEVKPKMLCSWGNRGPCDPGGTGGLWGELAENMRARQLVSQGPYTELRTLQWTRVRVLSPPPDKAQHPSSCAHTLRDPHRKQRAAAVLNPWSSSTSSSGTAHGFLFPLSPLFFTPLMDSHFLWTIASSHRGKCV